MNSKSFAFIPLKTVSQRLPNKNFLELNGIPLYMYTVQAAIESSQFERIIISTDADTSCWDLPYEVEVVNRIGATADPDLSVVEVIKKHISEDSLLLDDMKLMTVLYPTAPFRTADMITEMHQLYFEKSALSVTAVCHYAHYPFQAMYSNNDGSLSYYWEDLSLKKGQDMPPLFAGNGSTYLVNYNYFLSNSCLIARKRAFPYFMDQIHSVDLDTPDDLKLMRAIASYNYIQ